MSRVIGLEEIQRVLPGIDVVGLMEEAFNAYSEGRAVVPPVGELIFTDPPGETHIKYGFITPGDHYVIKIASGFYDNPALGLSSSQGVMLLLSQKTGVFEAVLLDDGHLTDVRTAAAGAVAAKHLAPTEVRRIGIVGGGIQARMQLEWLADVVACRRATVWTREDDQARAYCEKFSPSEFDVEVASSLEELAGRCNLIVTATPSRMPLLPVETIRPGTHITAVGSDTGDKIELDPAILSRADRVVVDSLPQAESRGEVFQAVAEGALDRTTVVELGAVVSGRVAGRVNDRQITICDLTGVAVQDLMIAQGVYEKVLERTKGES